MMIRSGRMAALTLLVLLTAAATASAEAAKSLRVATLLPSVEDALRDLPGVEVVAGVRRSFTAPERTDVIDLGSPHHPNVERLATSRADLVIADALINGHLEEMLTRFGAEVMMIDTTSVEGIFAGLVAVGRRVGAEQALEQRVASAREGVNAQKVEAPLRVLALFGTPGKFQVITDQNWIGSLLDTLALENLGAGVRGEQRIPGFVAVSQEHLSTLRPDLVLLVAHGDPRAIQGELQKQLAGNGPLGQLGKSASHGVHVLRPDLFMGNPGLALPAAAEALAAYAATTPSVAAP
ncbi:MAG: ABC transporter substrate-binding protein [Myxococcota bacterium]